MVQRGDAQDLPIIRPSARTLIERFPAQQFALELEVVDRTVGAWEKVCFIQCLCVRARQRKGIAPVASSFHLRADAGAPSRRVKAKGSVDEDVAPKPFGSKVDIVVWHPPTQHDFPKNQSKVANERRTEGTITACKHNRISKLTQHAILKVETGQATATKFGNRGRGGDDGGRCHGNTDAVGDSAQKSQPAGCNHGGDGSDADEWRERRESSRFRKKIGNIVARSFHANKNAEYILAPDSPEPVQEKHSPDIPDDESNHSLWVNWKHELADPRQIDWRQEVLNAQPDEGSMIDSQDVFLITPIDKLPGDMAKDEIQEEWQSFSKAKAKDIAWLYDLGCFKRWPRHKSNDIIDARWVITRRVIEGNVGAKRRLTVRGFNDKFQDLVTYAGATSRSGQRLVNAAAAENKDFALFSVDVIGHSQKGWHSRSSVLGLDDRFAKSNLMSQRLTSSVYDSCLSSRICIPSAKD